MFWNELCHLLKPIINAFVLIITINKTHPYLKSIGIKYCVNKIKQKLNKNFFQNVQINKNLVQTIF